MRDQSGYWQCIECGELHPVDDGCLETDLVECPECGESWALGAVALDWFEFSAYCNMLKGF